MATPDADPHPEEREMLVDGILVRRSRLIAAPNGANVAGYLFHQRMTPLMFAASPLAKFPQVP